METQQKKKRAAAQKQASTVDQRPMQQRDNEITREPPKPPKPFPERPQRMDHAR